MSKDIYNEKNWKKNIACLLISQAISMIGTMMVQYAIIWYVTLTTSSGTVIGLMSCAGLLPMVLVMPYAGALADHFNRKKIAIISDGCVAIISLVLAIIFFTNGGMKKDIPLLLGVLFIRSIGQGFQSPAVSSIVPQITPEKYLVQVNGIDQTIQAAMMLVSPALSASLLAGISLAWIVLIDCITAIIGITIMLFEVKIPLLTLSKEDPVKVFEQIKTGIKYIRTHKILITLITAGFIGSMLSTAASNFGPLQITRKFHDGLWQLSAIEIGFALGMLLGGLFTSFWGGFKDKIKTIAFGYSLLIIPFILLGITLDFWIYLITMVVVGFIVPISRTAMISFLQSETDHNYMGRVMSVVTMAISIASPITMLIIGPLADIISIDWIMIVSGIMLTPLTIWIFKKSS
ncbi:MFS transporter [Enterococcus devriesei]|uniref:MFS transporter n=1 Tax=Enterococcus devriesei TaxID=319970 RepID=UPI0036D28C6F